MAPLICTFCLGHHHPLDCPEEMIPDQVRAYYGTQGWCKEFGPVAAPPAAVQQLIDAQLLLDTSWHHDMCPSVCIFDTVHGNLGLRLWIHPANPADREEPETERYCVSRGLIDEEPFTTDDLVEALRILKLETSRADAVAAVQQDEV
jgi:hypothetical protein